MINCHYSVKENSSINQRVRCTICTRLQTSFFFNILYLFILLRTSMVRCWGKLKLNTHSFGDKGSFFWLNNFFINYRGGYNALLHFNNASKTHENYRNSHHNSPIVPLRGPNLAGHPFYHNIRQTIFSANQFRSIISGQDQ